MHRGVGVWDRELNAEPCTLNPEPPPPHPQVLPRVLEQIVVCRDDIAQQYLMQCVIQCFPDSFHLGTLDALLGSLPGLQPGVKVGAGAAGGQGGCRGRQGWAGRGRPKRCEFQWGAETSQPPTPSPESKQHPTPSPETSQPPTT